MSDTSAVAWPTELVIKRSAKVLAAAFEDSMRFDIPFELLRVESPSAQVQGHSTADKKIVTGKSAVMVVDARPVGRYAIRLIFDDGHDSGIFTWNWLYRLGRDQDALMAAYRAATSSPVKG